MKNGLLIIGAGQYGIVAKEIAEEMGVFEKIDFLDDKNESAVGKINDYDKFANLYSHAFVAIGSNKMRLEFIEKLQSFYKIAILKSKFAYISPLSTIEEGTIIEQMAIVQANAKIEKGCLICSGTIVKHNAHVGQGCYLDCNCVVQAGAVVKTETKVEAGTVFI